jgi:hydrogenase maturation protease
MASPAPLVASLGQSARGDDGVGPEVVQKLAQVGPPEVRYLDAAGDPTRLLAAWSDAPIAWIVDAARAPPGSPALPGRVRRLDGTATVLPGEVVLTSSHALSLAETLALGRALGQLPQHLVIYAVEGSNFERKVGLGPAVKAAAGRLVARLVSEIQNELRRRSMLHA